ncbi:hypothetical protein BU14_0261s0004 [Porphyra umbilicalis]|uniref:Uncharacterized protein n=1 Tax=Porphyra umbilicalis TaxID=2786 RepID=A0A1X6P221_PORUM|nr:hypothetical protein BU14_0261s0004 [Porphyra umbilicalis]|eukprot:OSX74914.1 hypothetical protein BU14_0261s0004 [Porphyra umbilicalis]
MWSPLTPPPLCCALVRFGRRTGGRATRRAGCGMLSPPAPCPPVAASTLDAAVAAVLAAGRPVRLIDVYVPPAPPPMGAADVALLLAVVAAVEGGPPGTGGAGGEGGWGGGDGADGAAADGGGGDRDSDGGDDGGDGDRETLGDGVAALLTAALVYADRALPLAASHTGSRADGLRLLAVGVSLPEIVRRTVDAGRALVAAFLFDGCVGGRAPPSAGGAPQTGYARYARRLCAYAAVELWAALFPRVPPARRALLADAGAAADGSGGGRGGRGADAAVALVTRLATTSDLKAAPLQLPVGPTAATYRCGDCLAAGWGDAEVAEVVADALEGARVLPAGAPALAATAAAWPHSWVPSACAAWARARWGGGHRVGGGAGGARRGGAALGGGCGGRHGRRHGRPAAAPVGRRRDRRRWVAAAGGAAAGQRHGTRRRHTAAARRGRGQVGGRDGGGGGVRDDVAAAVVVFVRMLAATEPRARGGGGRGGSGSGGGGGAGAGDGGDGRTAGAVAVPLVGTVAALPIGTATQLLTAVALAADRLTVRAAAAVVPAAVGAVASASPAVAPAWQRLTRDLPPPPPLPPRGRGGAAAAAPGGGSWGGNAAEAGRRVGGGRHGDRRPRRPS